MNTKRLQQFVAESADKLSKHPIGETALTREQLCELAIGQHFNSLMWPGYLATMRDRVNNPVLKQALQDNAICEIGNLNTSSHVTLSQRMLESLGVSSSRALSMGMPKSARVAFALMTRVSEMNEAQICGWSYATESLTPVRFRVLLPQFQMTEGIDSTYLHEHVAVDTDVHAPRILEAAEVILNHEAMLTPMLEGAEFAVKRAIAIFDGIMPTPSERGEMRPGRWGY